MIIYKYSLIEDLKWSYRTLINLGWLKEKNLKIFYPNPFRMVHLWFKRPKPNIQSNEDYICYWIHAGTWGSYTPPNKIFICPWRIAGAGGFERLIKHEIIHLKHSHVAENMTHERKEKLIRYYEKRNKN